MHLPAGIAAARARLERAWGSSEALALVLVLLAAAALLFVALGNHDFWRPDEPRYGAIAEELRSFVHGWRGLVLLHSNGVAYTQKPPLFFWLGALFGAPFGRVTEAAARLPSALGGFATLLAVAWLGRALFRPRVGVIAAAVLLAVPGWVQLARSARLDALLTCFVTLAFVAAWRLDRRLGEERRDRLLLHGAIGLGMLTKGPVALLLPLLAVVAYLAWERRLSEWRRYVSPGSLLLSVGPAVVWLACATLLAPAGFANASFWDNLILRFFAGTAHKEPVWFYLDRMPRGFLPWSLLWPAVWWRYQAAQRDAATEGTKRAWRFLLAAAGTGFVFFSASAGKRGVYLLPLFPLLAIVSAEPLTHWLERAAEAPRWLRRGLALAAAALVVAGLGTLAFERVGGVVLPASVGLSLAAAAAVALVAEPRLRRRVSPRIALFAAALGVLFVGEGVVFQRIYPALNDRNSARAVAELAGAATPPDKPIGVYRSESLSGAIAYYGRRPARNLHEPADLAPFTEAGGFAIVVEDKDLVKLRTTTSVRELGQGQSRHRKLYVVTPDI